MLTRRRVIISLGASTVVWPLGSLAQQPDKVWRVGMMIATGNPSSPPNVYQLAFVQKMRELGYVEGKNLIIERRFEEGNKERVPEFVDELLRLKVDVFVTTVTPSALAIQRATRISPIVFVNLVDPVGSGLAASLSRPGGNATGLTGTVFDSSPKLLDLLKLVVPRLTRVAVFLNPDNSGHPGVLPKLQAAAQTVGVQTLRVDARTPEEIESGFLTIKRERAQAIILVNDTVVSG